MIIIECLRSRGRSFPKLKFNFRLPDVQTFNTEPLIPPPFGHDDFNIIELISESISHGSRGDSRRGSAGWVSGCIEQQPVENEKENATSQEMKAAAGGGEGWEREREKERKRKGVYI